MKMNHSPRLRSWKIVRNVWIYTFLLPCVIVFLFFYLIPIVTVLVTSFTQWGGWQSPTFIGFDNYIRLWNAPSFMVSLRNLFWWSVIAIVIHVGFGVLVAFVLHRRPFGWKFTRAVFMIPNVISMAAWSLIFRFAFDIRMGFINDIIQVFNPDFNVNWLATHPYAFWVVTFTWLFFSVVVMLIVQGDLKAIGTEIHEAARIDGANVWHMVTRIDLPLCRNAIGTGIILSLTSRIAMFESIVLLTNGGPGSTTMNIPILMVRRILDHEYGYANAMATVMIIIGVATLLIVNKLFRMSESYY